MKKIFALLGVLLVLFTLTSLAEETEYQWKDFRYRILEDGTAEITGHEGMDMKNYNILTGKDKRIKNLTIPSQVNGIPVTSVGVAAFSGPSLQKVTISEGITHIRRFAFNQCRNLKTLKLPSTLLAIDELAFSDNDKLSSLKLPKNLTHIGESAFHSCDGLKKLTIPDSVTHIGKEAFGFCENLKEVSIGANVQYPGYDPFSGECDNPFGACDKLTTIKVSKKNPYLTVMEGCLVDLSDMRLIAYPAGKKGSSFTVPEGIKIIGESAFLWCDKLEKITFPDSVEKVAAFGISNLYNLKEMVFGEGLTAIEGYGFNSLYALESLTLPASLETIGEKVAEDSDKQVTLYVPGPCPAALWGAGMGFKVVFTDPAAFTILSPQNGDHVDLKYGGDITIEWLAHPEADSYEVQLTFTLPETGISVAYPTLYTNGDPDASGRCSVKISPPAVFNRLYETLGGPYAYSQWQATVEINACRVQ